MLCFASSPVYLILDMTHDLLFYGIDGVSFTCFRMSLFSLIIFLRSSARKQQKTNQNKKKKNKNLVIWLPRGWHIQGENQSLEIWFASWEIHSVILKNNIYSGGRISPSILIGPACMPDWVWLNLPSFLVLPLGSTPVPREKALLYS